MLAVRPATELKLEYGTRALIKEFPHLPCADVVHEVDTVTRSLVEGARFDDYIPVLVYRFARERLRERRFRSPLADAA